MNMKRLEARAKPDYKAGSIMAFSGHEYTRGEWRLVPAGFEEQARAHPYLEVRAFQKDETEKIPTAAKVDEEKIPAGPFPSEKPDRSIPDDSKKKKITPGNG
jgi:hypothetical protein